MRCQFDETGKVPMKLFIFSLALAASLAGCASEGSTASMGASGPGGATAKQVGMCEVFRGYESRSPGGENRAACDRQLGADLCARCLSSGL
jgi:hypothetical protein